jgi:hypothetical protein
MENEAVILTKAEVEKQLRKAFPDASDADIRAALPRVTSQKDIKYVIEKKGMLPESFWGQVFTGTDYLSPSFSEQLNAGVNKGMLFLLPAGKLQKVGSGGKALLNLGKSFFAKKSVEEGGKAATKMSLKKKAVIGAGVLAVGQAGSSMMNRGQAEIDINAQAAELQAKDSFAQALANADAQGIDVTQFLQGDAAQQLGLGANNIGNFMAARGYTNPLVGLNGIGVFTGKIETGTKLGPKGKSYATNKSEIVGLADWNKRFPVDLAGVAAAKQKFVDAGVLSPTADLTQVKTAWNQYGQLSLDYSRAGNKVSPWQLLDIQKGLTGSGSQTTTTIDDSQMAKADITTLLKRQLQASLGLANVDDSVINKFIADVRKKEAKNPTKTVRTTTGNTTRVKSTPGYSQADVLADAEAYAKQDPRYAEFQTADVFGNALIKALGLKS